MDLVRLPTYGHDGLLNVVVETPRGARVKLRYEPDRGIFELSRPLQLGLSYPYDWGFVPSTRAPDGDALDAMVYQEIATYPGVVIPCRPIGVVHLTQKRPGSAEEENPRLLVVPKHETQWPDARELDAGVREQIARFFEIVVSTTDKTVRITGWGGPDDAGELVARTREAFGRG